MRRGRREQDRVAEGWEGLGKLESTVTENAYVGFSERDY
jgi:hypothetical protein